MSDSGAVGFADMADAYDSVQLISELGFSATVDLDNWMLIDVPCVVRRDSPAYSWAGLVVGFAPSVRCKVEWTQKSGKRRSWLFYDKAAEGKPLGHEFELTEGRYKRWATVVERGPATLVRIQYTITSGPKTRPFFIDEAVPAYGRRDGDMVNVFTFDSWPL